MISPIKSYSYSPVYTNFTATPETPKTTDIAVEELEKGNQKKFKIKKYSELSDKQKKGVLYASIALAGLTGLVIGRGRSLSRSSWMMDEMSRTSERYLAASEELSRVKAELEDLRAIYETSSGSESALRRVTSELREKFTELVESDLSPREIREQIFARMRALIEENPLSYDPMSPPITGKGIRRFEDAVELPSAGTNIRANMQPLQIPLISESGEFRFVLPRGEMRVSKMTSKDFVPVYKQPTTISIGYADALNWDNDKVARDILQNFFDGHGQTLDGVRFEFVPLGNGKFRVRISGDSTYTVDKALFMGESTKRNDARSAGNYGEGLKMAVLKLLKSGGADSVRVGSDNWKLTYELANTDLTDKQILSYSIDKVEKLDGNFLEFETTDRDLLVKLRDSINRFYHSGNEHFKTPGFENRFVGIKTDLGPNDKGGIYIAGQRFEYDGNYSDFDNSVLFIKEKPDARTLDVSRDRISLSLDELGKLGGWVATHGENYIGISEGEALKLIQSLEKYWGKVYKVENNKGFDAFLTSFIDYFAILHKDIHIKFPEKCVAGIGKIILAIANFFCNIYLTVIRGTPVVVQLMIMYYIIFATSDNGILVAVSAFGINSGAYVAEIFRSGIMSVDNGQFEAGRSLGFGYISTMLFIVFPQAFKSVLPALANEFIVLLKETSVAGYVAIKDLTKGGDIIRGATYETFMPLLAVAGIYLVMVIFFTKLVNILERRLRKSER